MDKKVLVAMSGGVDSSVAALLMQEQGYDCLGVTMHLFHNEDAGIVPGKTCCALDDIEDARSVAYRLGMPYYVFNFTDAFNQQVIDRFVSAYEEGATPNPCIDCNRYMKFDKLYERAMNLGACGIATGHYVRIEKTSGRYLLKKAVDASKDQSYVLYFMTQEQLAHTYFPLGGMSKPQIRAMAEAHGFVNADKPDSQDICFVPDSDYAKVIETRTGKHYPHGSFVDTQGRVLGRHRGIIRYTIGQRKGLGLSLGEPMYVCEKRMHDHSVVLGRSEDLFSRELDARDFNWIAFETPPGTLRVKAKLRYKQAEQWASVTATGADSVHICFDEPQRAIARGQAIVLYDGDVVVGGGTIC